MPSGPPISTAAVRPTAIITRVSPRATHSSGSTSTIDGGSAAQSASSILALLCLRGLRPACRIQGPLRAAGSTLGRHGSTSLSGMQVLHQLAAQGRDRC